MGGFFKPMVSVLNFYLGGFQKYEAWKNVVGNYPD